MLWEIPNNFPNAASALEIWVVDDATSPPCPAFRKGVVISSTFDVHLNFIRRSTHSIDGLELRSGCSLDFCVFTAVCGTG